MSALLPVFQEPTNACLNLPWYEQCIACVGKQPYWAAGGHTRWVSLAEVATIDQGSCTNVEGMLDIAMLLCLNATTCQIRCSSLQTVNPGLPAPFSCKWNAQVTHMHCQTSPIQSQGLWSHSAHNMTLDLWPLTSRKLYSPIITCRLPSLPSIAC